MKMERIDDDSISLNNDTVALSSSESSSDNENENLAFYVNNRVKILQRMFKVLHTKKIMKMAPACLKNKNIAEIKAALIEELMGLSDRRVLQIINGEKEGHKGDGSSSESEVDQHFRNPASRAIDGGVISLDDITDDDEIDVIPMTNIKTEKDESNSVHKKRHKKSSKKLVKKIKKEPDLDVVEINEEKTAAVSGDEEKKDPAVMSALNLLELQARARAIRSQLRSELGEINTDSKSNKKDDADKENDDGDKSNDADKANTEMIERDDDNKVQTDEVVDRDDSVNKDDLSDKIDGCKSLVDKKINEIIDANETNIQDLSPNSVVCISPERDVIILDNSDMDMDFDEKEDEDVKSVQKDSKIPSKCVLIKSDDKNKLKTKNNEKHKHSKHKSKTNGNGKHKHKSKTEPSYDKSGKSDKTKSKSNDNEKMSDTLKSKIVCSVKIGEMEVNKRADSKSTSLTSQSHDEDICTGGDKSYGIEEKIHSTEDKSHCIKSKSYSSKEKVHVNKENIEEKSKSIKDVSPEKIEQKNVPDSTKGKVVKLKRKRFTKEDLAKMRRDTEMRKEIETAKVVENVKIVHSGDESDTSDVIICNVEKDIDLDI